ncbi:hypothetical protein M436DRAFT_37219 [Aureobasidium namibiae CBS 147.97]|uniref:Uncharacterized protein n=1 Tax=Aureobasidium namibiae CBS 147.97 TaxID=1043004 RepID=A0A074X7L1_9PEZI|nr:uncharacterized protein M436DRAFT_37219 [Aureobasidium namibiae CBS 147.97]KEQ78017.1 hypothetical protein M436DRAFT_37219 [Aureobasidium namibiae CBS 147.97]
MTDPCLCNDGHGPLKVPGFSDVPIDLELCPQNRFTHGATEWTQWPNLTARELAMLALINDLTEEHGWHEKVFNDNLMVDWRMQALSRPLVSPKAWDWCLAELRDKALYFEQTGNIVVFNTGAGIIKSDAVAERIQTELRDATELLEADEKVSRQHTVLDLVDPSLFPLVYGRTRVLMDSGRVTLDSTINSCGRGEIVIPTPHAMDRDDERWSARYQWLPCEVDFVNDSGTDVRITSYVNNLHPIRYRALYGTIAKLVSQSIEPWNQILIKQNRGRTPMRIRTYGLEPDNERPEWATHEKLRELESNRSNTAFKEAVDKIKEYLALPERLEEKEGKQISPTWETEDGGLWTALYRKWTRLRTWQHPEPGTAFGFNDWKAGRAEKAIIDMRIVYPDSNTCHNFYKVALQDSFRKKGLQVVVKISSIELTPEDSAYDGTDWHLDGMLNDHIVASALHVFDIKNVTEARLSFRQQTRMEQGEFHYEGWKLESLMDVFAIPGDSEDIDGSVTCGCPASLQDLGSVVAPQGRLLAWPNVLHHRMEPMQLLDPTVSGHCKFISLHLVDPHYRICSTRNVPPQRHDWWVEEAIEATGAAKHGLPAELIHQIDAETENWPMGIEEAERVRLEREHEQNTVERYIFKEGAHRYIFGTI